MSTAKTTKEVLQAAKWMLENVGWIKGEFVKYADGAPIGYCAAGAINRVEIYWTDSLNLTDAARHEVSKAAGMHLVNFNDDENTSKEDVLKAFDKAIASVK